MAVDLYRQTPLGDALVEALESMMEKEQISEELADNIMKQFDASMIEALRNHVTGKATIKANLKNYRYIDGIWQFILTDVSFKLAAGGSGSMNGTPEVKCATAKIISIDAKTFEEQKPAGEPAE